MAIGRFRRLILGTGLTGTDNGDDTLTIDATVTSTPSLAAVLAVGHDANGIEITNGATPTTAASLATKAYVDAVAQGLSIKNSCRLATAAALPAVTLVGSTLVAVSVGVLTIDGQAVALNDRVLVKDQVAGAQNGIYTCTTAGTSLVAFILTRATDSDTSAEIVGGFTFIEEGTVNAASGFVNTNSGTITVGTTAITYTQFSGAGEITAGAALTKTGNTLDVAVDGSTIEVSGDALRVKDAGIGVAKLTSAASAADTVAQADGAGAVSFIARIKSLGKSGSTALTGAVTLTGGANVTLTQSGNDIAIAAVAGGGGGGGFVASDTIWDAAGDLVVGTGADAGARLAIGAKGAVLQSSGTTAAWAIPDGWIDDSANTWTYASASTFTMSGDRTAQFQKGTRLRFTQTTVKYGTVALSSFASSTTTVTIIVNTDYVLANAAISVNSYSQAASPDGYPSLFAYSSTQTGFSGTPTVTAKFAVFGRVCHVFIQVDGTSNNAAWTWSLPVTSLQAEYLACVSYSVAAFASGRAAIGGGSSTVTMGIGAGADGGYTASQGKGGYMALTVAF